jgi:hypothetical protein
MMHDHTAILPPRRGTCRLSLSLLLVAFLCLGFAPPRTEAALPTAETHQEISYPADGRPQMAEFRAAGTVTLLVPKDPVVSPLGTLTIEAVEQRIYASRDISIYRNGTWQVVGQLESVSVLGTVQGHPLSTVSLLLDPHGIYGHVEVPLGEGEAAFRLHPYAEDEADNESFTQHVWLDRNDPAGALAGSASGQAQEAYDETRTEVQDGARNATEPQAEPQGSSTQAKCGSQSKEVCKAVAQCKDSGTTPTYSIVWMIATAGSTGFAAKHKDWQARISSGFTDFKPLLLKDGLCIDASIKLSKTSDINPGGPPVLSSDSCTSSNDVVTQFQQWLRTNAGAFTSASAASETDAYQLWTSKDLIGIGDGPNGYYCFGLADSDEVVRSISDPAVRAQESLDAASVVEGHDVNCCDGYDPDEQKHRAIASGHETSHVFGEENHPMGGCGPRNDHNIMAKGVHKDFVDVCYLSYTVNEIKARYFRGSEP